MLNGAYAKIKKKLGKRRILCIYNYSRRRQLTTNKVIQKALLLLLAPAALLKSRSNTLSNVEMDITSRCTLNCKECSHLVPRYKNAKQARDYDTEMLLENIDLLLSFVNNILLFTVLGGEPLLHRDLHRIISKLTASDKIKTVKITTNGTIIPQGENLTALKHKKVIVSISNYGELSSKAELLSDTLKSNGISVIIPQSSTKWCEFNGFDFRGYSFAVMEKIFSKCVNVGCKSLYNGKLWLCPYALHGITLGLLPDNKDQYIDLKASTVEEFWNKLERLYNVTPPEGKGFACYYCSGGSFEYAKEVPCAEQV